MTPGNLGDFGSYRPILSAEGPMSADQTNSRRVLGPVPAVVRKGVIGAGLVTYAWVASAMPPFSARSLLGVLVPGAVLGAIAYGLPPERIRPPERIDVAGFSYWAIGVALLFEWEASAVLSGSSWWHPR
jgi:hypothetical protein